MGYAEKEGKDAPRGSDRLQEKVRRSLAWLGEECGLSEAESLCVFCDAARELRINLKVRRDAPRGIAGILERAIACFELLCELRPGGLQLEELERTATRIKLTDLLKKMGDDAPDREETLRRLLEISRALREERIEPELFLEVAAQARTFAYLRRMIADHGGTEARIRALHELGLWLESKRVTLGQVKGLVDYLTSLLDLGFSVDIARSIAVAYCKAKKEGKEGADAAEYLIRLAQEGIVIQDEIQRLRNSRRDLWNQIEGLRRERGALSPRMK